MRKMCGVFGDVLGRIAGVVHEDFLRGDENAHGGLETFDVELAVVAFELHQVQRREIAGGVVDENVFAARIGGVNRLGAFAGVPFLDRAVVLHAGVAANPRAFGDFVQQLGWRPFFWSGLPVVTERVHHSLPASAACMNSSLARTERFSF